MSAINIDPIAAELARMFRLPVGNGCGCDFCTGVKRYEDNWCGRCGEVQMQPPKWWENLDVCDACEALYAIEIGEVVPR